MINYAIQNNRIEWECFCGYKIKAQIYYNCEMIERCNSCLREYVVRNKKGRIVVLTMSCDQAIEQIEEHSEFLQDLKSKQMVWKDESVDFKRDIAKRSIEKLVHFSKVENIVGVILCGGIISREVRNKLVGEDSKCHFFAVRDVERLDEQLEGISCSIEHPNQYFFERKRSQPNSLWCVLTLSPDLIYCKETLFYHYNAASNIARSLRGEQLKHFNTIFNEQVEDSYGRMLRRDPPKKMCYPTSFQAEILVKNFIPWEKILGINFESKEALSKAEDWLEPILELFGREGIDYLSKFQIAPQFWEMIDERSFE